MLLEVTHESVGELLSAQENRGSQTVTQMVEVYRCSNHGRIQGRQSRDLKTFH